MDSEIRTPPTRRRIGIDLGGTKMEGVVVDDAAGVITRSRWATERERGYDHIVERIANLVVELRAHAPGCDLVGIGTPGAVTRAGTMKNSNTTCLNGRPLPADLERRLAMTVRIENDANCFALAEASAGAGRGAELVFGVILGTGVGGGIVHRNQLWRGPQRLAGEWGHHGIDPAGPGCYCGRRGCVETFLSGPALEREYESASGGHLDVPEIVSRYRSGESFARTVFSAYLERFGRALANLIDILDPEIVVLGGGLSNIDELYEEGRQAVARFVFNDELATPIVRHQLGDSAGVLGAALLS